MLKPAAQEALALLSSEHGHNQNDPRFWSVRYVPSVHGSLTARRGPFLSP